MPTSRPPGCPTVPRVAELATTHEHSLLTSPSQHAHQHRLHASWAAAEGSAANPPAACAGSRRGAVCVLSRPAIHSSNQHLQSARRAKLRSLY